MKLEKDLTDFITQLCLHIRLHVKFDSIQDFYNQLCPIASIGQVNGLLFPPCTIFGTPAGKEYYSKLILTEITGLTKWMDTIGKLTKKHASFADFDEMYTKKILHEKINIDTWLIPAVEPNYAKQHFSRDYVHLKLVGVWEYCKIRKLVQFHEFVDEIIQIALFGFPLTEEVVELLGIQAVELYVKSRLLEGIGDRMLNKESISTNFFANLSDLYKKDSSFMLNSLYTQMSHTENLKENFVSKLIQNQHFLGESSEYITKLIENKMYRGGIHFFYQLYLLKNTGFKKIGPKLFSQLYSLHAIVDVEGDSSVIASL
jgi:hypothetical protein